MALAEAARAITYGNFKDTVDVWWAVLVSQAVVSTQEAKPWWGIPSQRQ